MRPTCTDCAIKHLAQASILLQESRHGYPDHIYYARGHLAEAEAELSQLYPVHAELVRKERKLLEADGEYSPDFTALMKKIDTECEVCELAGNPRKTSCELKIERCVLQLKGDPRIKNPYATCRSRISCTPGVG